MKQIRFTLAIALFFSAIVLLAFAGTNLVAAPVWLVFQKTPGLGTANTIAQITAYLTMIFLFAAAAVVAVPTALQPAIWLRKSLHVLPAYLLLSTIAAVIANILGIATLGSITDPQSAFKVSLATAWLGASGVLVSIAVVWAAYRADLSDRILKAATRLTGIAILPGLVLCLAMLASVYIVATNPSGLPVPQSPAPSPPGGFGSFQGLVTLFEIGGGLMTVFAIIALTNVVVALKTKPPTAPTLPVDYRRETGRALVSAIAISIIVLLAMQLVPVSRENPPVLASVQWDSPQTQTLVYRACMNCHSNETQWPWYATFAPGSWLTSVHVNSARQQYNLSELNKLPAFRKARLARDMADAIRNGVMPPIDYQLLHPEAQLTAVEKEQLIQGLQNSIK
jgi:hypothetical protein